MKKHDYMLDPTMLMMMGLMDHPVILEMETKRLKDIKDKVKIKELIKRCMENKTIRETLEIDEDLAELFVFHEMTQLDKGVDDVA